jgi:hypothetical protein
VLIEIKPKGTVEYQGKSRSGHIITIEKQDKGFMVRAYKIKCDDLLKEPLSWDEAFKVFQSVTKGASKHYEWKK